MKKRILGELGDLYDVDSAAHHGAFGGLRQLLLDVGFVVEKKRATEGTLRVYPVKNKQYPLLNPFFSNYCGSESDSMQNRECLVIDVLWKGDFSALERHLQNFQPGLSCTYAADARDEAGYHRAGHFLIPLSFAGQKAPYRMDFEPLREPLAAIYQHLRRW